MKQKIKFDMPFRNVFLIVCASIILLLVGSCERRDRSRTMSAREVPLTELQKRTYEGDKEAYGDLFMAYFSDQNEDILYWAMLMANKYDYAQAYYDVFYVLTYGEALADENYGIKAVDAKTRLLALSYLKIAAERNVEDALNAWQDIKKADSTITDDFKGISSR